MPGAKERTAREHVPLRSALAGTAVRACVLAVVLGASTLAMLEPVVSLWLADAMGLNPARVGLVFGVAAVASVVLHPVYGRLADAWGARRLMLVGLVATGGLLPVLSQAWSFESAVVLYVIQAAAMSLIVTPSLAYMAEAISVVGESSFGVAYGVYNFSWGVGLLAGPAVGGFLYDTVGFTSLTLVWAPAVIGLTLVIAKTAPAVHDATL